MDLKPLVVSAAIAIGLPGLAAAAHLGLLAVASWLYREPRGESPERTRFLVLVPAHNEEAVIASCLQAIMADKRLDDHVLVVADRCTDDTARVARSLGASVLARSPHETAGRAAARQAGLDHARSLEWDAVLMLDADSVIEPGFFAACEQAMATGAKAIQARSESGHGRTVAQRAAIAAFTLQGVTIPRGRARLGLSVRLRGTGMAIRRELALTHRFHAPASEDLFFTLDLLLEGVRCRHVDSARLRSEGAGTWQAFGGQKVRYEAGRMTAARENLGPLLRRGVRHRDAACFEAAWFLATPPFAAAALLLLLAGAMSAIVGAWTAAAGFAVGVATLALAVGTGLIQARAGARIWLALLAAPWYMVWKAVVQVRALISVLRREKAYGPTARA